MLAIKFFYVMGYCICMISPHDLDCPTCRNGIYERTGCKASATCGNITAVNLNDFQSKILDFHNELRHLVASGTFSNYGWQSATNMMELHYDEKHEDLARCMILMCYSYIKFPEVYDRTGKRLSFNLHISENSGQIKVLIEEALESWKSASNKCSHNNQNRYIDIPRCRPFTQMIWATTTSLGCAAHYFKVTVEHPKTFMMACFYDEPGNIKGNEVYRVGIPTSECPNKALSKNYMALCKDMSYSSKTNNKYGPNVIVNVLSLAIYMLIR